MREWRTKQLRLMLLSTLLQASKGCMFTLSTLSPLVQRANSCVNDRLGSVIHMLMTDSVFPLFTAVYLEGRGDPCIPITENNKWGSLYMFCMRGHYKRWAMSFFCYLFYLLVLVTPPHLSNLTWIHVNYALQATLIEAIIFMYCLFLFGDATL